MIHPALDCSPAALAGTMVARRFLVGRRLGAGGTADVYEARDVRLDRMVAVKVLARGGGGDDERASARFAEEIRLLSGLSHRRLLPLLEADADGPHPYLVLPLVQGPTLADRLRLGPVRPAEVRRIGVALADVLGYLHSRDVVHRDVKPGNVLLGPDGAVHLIDFGAALAPDSPRLTPPNFVIGTAGYVPPEQAEGAAVRPAGDVYALGLVLLEALRGQPEYCGSPTERLVAVLRRPPSIPATLGTGWCRLIEALTRRDPARRPTAPAVAALLAGIGAGVPASTVDGCRRSAARVNRRPPVVARRERVPGRRA